MRWDSALGEDDGETRGRSRGHVAQTGLPLAAGGEQDNNDGEVNLEHGDAYNIAPKPYRAGSQD
jgi:hypothetical protein